jgi:DNA-binding HxlR family transcriptional regulator
MVELTEKIDKLIHEPARLVIIAHLYVVTTADFLFLMRLTDTTFGNLSSHLSKLESVGYVSIKKEFVGKKPHTMIKLTKKGRIAFSNYKKRMKQIFKGL